MDNKQDFSKHPKVMAAIAELLATAMEVNKEDGVNVWFDFSGHVNWAEIRVAVGDFRNDVRLEGEKYISFTFHGWGKDGDEEFEAARSKFLTELIEQIDDKKRQLMALGARYGGLTSSQIAKLKKQELAAREVEQMDQSIKAVEEKLEKMRAERKRMGQGLDGSAR